MSAWLLHRNAMMIGTSSSSSSSLRRPMLLSQRNNPFHQRCTVSTAVGATRGDYFGCRNNTLDELRTNHNTTTNIPTKRYYHTTKRQEIAPLIGVALVVIVGRYTWKALQRMEDDLEEYNYKLQQYEKSMIRNSGVVVVDGTRPKTTMAIDLGTIYTKLASVSYNSQQQPIHDIIISREGDRSFFNGILYSDNTIHNHVIAARGRAALERFHSNDEVNDNDDIVYLPSQLLASAVLQQQSSEMEDMACQVVRDALTPNLQDALDRIVLSNDSNNDDKTRIRKVITVPVSYLQQYQMYHSIFQKGIGTRRTNNNVDVEDEVCLLPEPVAAIWGAQMKQLLPDDTMETRGGSKSMITSLVVDVGGYMTQLSMVQNNDTILYSVTIPWGGETFIDLAIQYIITQGNSKQFHNVNTNDPRLASALQYHTRNAISELSGLKSRVQMNIPYLFADPNNHHLDTEVSRIVLQQSINDDIRDNLVPHKIGEGVLLSPHMPPPMDMKSLWTSLITNLLENSHQVPMNIDHVLIVGGGSKLPVVTESLEVALYTLMGPDAGKKFIRPDASIRSELTALGAATMLPSYEYSIVEGRLVRKDDDEES